MPELVVQGTLLACDKAVKLPPGPPNPIRTLPPAAGNSVNGLPIATIKDFALGANLATFGQCLSSTNPAVKAANAAGSPFAPCTPVIATPWTGADPSVTVGGVPALHTKCQNICTLGGKITIERPAQKSTTVR